MNSKTKSVINRGRNTKTKKSRKTFAFKVFKTLTILFIVLSCAAVGIVGGIVFGYIKTAEPITPDQLMLSGLTTFVYDSKGKEIMPLRGAKNRELVEYKDVPQDLKDAFVAIEDERFRDHNGIDLRRIASSVLSLFKHGGSTITQQVVRNITEDTDRTLKRKIQEQYRALDLEKHMEKWQILEVYMNVIYMGENFYGVQSASKGYFGKDVSELSLAECASLAGITNSPALYDPLTTKGAVNNKKRQKLILNKMLELEYITQQEYDKAIAEELVFKGSDKVATSPATNTKQSYFVDQVINDVTRDLMDQGMSKEMAQRMIYNNGLKIYTTMDSNVQKAMDEVFNDKKYFTIVNKKAGQPQAAMVILDPKTGQVKALYGGYGPKNADMILNRATQINRQPGSVFKPIAVYAPAIDLRLITPATLVDDSPVYMNGLDKPRYPENYDHTYRGLTNIRDAIRDSINVVAAKVWNDILGYEQSHAYLKKVGIDRSDEKTVSLALGGLKKGVSPLQMASAYMPFSNKGMYVEPTTYTKVEDKTGKVILQKNSKSTIVYDESTAYIMTDMLKDVCRIGTAYPYGRLQGGNMPTAGKTGTTNDNKDKWFVGFSPYYVGATWYGYDSPTPIASSERSNALKIWNDVMERVHKGLEQVDFDVPVNIERKTTCIYSGKTPSKLCINDPRQNAIRPNELFIKDSGPTPEDLCDAHALTLVCKDSKDAYGRNLLAGPNCPSSSSVQKLLVRRQQPYVPQKSDEPYPKDLVYNYPVNEFCKVHGR